MNQTAYTALTQQAHMIALLKKLAPTEGYTQSLLDGVTFMRSNRPLSYTQALYEPSIVIVLQGRKRGMHGGNTYVYDAQHYLVLSVPLPFTVETEASEDEPMLGLALRIDPTMTAELTMGLDEAGPQPVRKPSTMYSTRMDVKLGDATSRLLEALSSPSEAKLLGSSIFREITYRVLTGDQGDSLRATLMQGGNFGRIAKVLRRIHSQYHSNLDVATLASEANMSTAAFHTHFKAITTTSPIQYIKAIRLHHARLLMIRNGVTAAIASGQVGYESTSQFSREFKRLFRRSPTNEVEHLKELLSLASPVVHPRSDSARFES
jgi:AraC-like DNA-binding protein